jgi:hypothetical protein
MMRCWYNLIYDYEAPEEIIKEEPKMLYDWKTFEQFMWMEELEESEENLFDRIR